MPPSINTWTLREWYNNDEMKRSAKKRPVALPTARAASDSETPDEKLVRLEREVARLERENAQLKMDREILKKATAFFAKESE